MENFKTKLETRIDEMPLNESKTALELFQKRKQCSENAKTRKRWFYYTAENPIGTHQTYLTEVGSFKTETECDEARVKVPQHKRGLVDYEDKCWSKYLGKSPTLKVKLTRIDFMHKGKKAGLTFSSMNICKATVANPFDFTNVIGETITIHPKGTLELTRIIEDCYEYDYLVCGEKVNAEQVDFFK